MKRATVRGQIGIAYECWTGCLDLLQTQSRCSIGKVAGYEKDCLMVTCISCRVEGHGRHTRLQIRIQTNEVGHLHIHLVL